MKNIHLFFCGSFILLFVLSGCLTCETKTYKFELLGKGKGRLTVTYSNIFSSRSDEELEMNEEIESDFNELVYEYLQGDKLISELPNAKLISRKLFEAGGKLNGEVVYEFTNINQVHLFQTDAKGPYMYLLNAFSMETVLTTNGSIGPDYFKVVYWNKKLKTLEFTSSIESMNEDGKSLLPMWKSMKK